MFGNRTAAQLELAHLINERTMRRARGAPNWNLLGGLGQFEDFGSYDWYFTGGDEWFWEGSDAMFDVGAGPGASGDLFFDDFGNVVDDSGNIVFTAEDFGFTGDTGAGYLMDDLGNVYDETGNLIYTAEDLGFGPDYYSNLETIPSGIPYDLDTTTGIYYDEANDIAAFYGGTYNPTNGLLDFGGITGFVDELGNLVLYGPNGAPAVVMDPVTGLYFDPSTGAFTSSGDVVGIPHYPAGTRLPGGSNAGVGGSGGPGFGSGSSQKPTPQQQQQLANRQAALRSLPLQQAGLYPGGGISTNTLLIAGGALLIGALLSRKGKA